MLIRRDKHVPLFSLLRNLEKELKSDTGRSKSIGIVKTAVSKLSENEAMDCTNWVDEDSENRIFVQNLSSIRGCEFDILIICGYEREFIMELATRAREKLLFITSCG